MPRTSTAALPSNRPHRDKIPAWYDPSDPDSVARYQDLVADRADARAAGVPVVWWQGYRRYLGFVTEHGRAPVRRETEGKWVQDQRAARKNGRLNDAQIALLDTAPHFGWDVAGGRRPDEDTWREWYDRLVAFLDAHGRYPKASEDRALFDWWRRQSGDMRGYLTDERRALLARLPVVG